MDEAGPSPSLEISCFEVRLASFRNNIKLQSKVEAEAPLGSLSLSGLHSVRTHLILLFEKVTILSCIVSAFSPPFFSPRLGRFFRFFNESLHESCNRIKDILSSWSVCLMPSIESIGALLLLEAGQ
ncbi:hypothetical protein Tco_1266359 [Tanacetum coccineum]